MMMLKMKLTTMEVKPEAWIMEFHSCVAECTELSLAHAGVNPVYLSKTFTCLTLTLDYLG